MVGSRKPLATSETPRGKSSGRCAMRALRNGNLEIRRGRFSRRRGSKPAAPPWDWKSERTGISGGGL